MGDPAKRLALQGQRWELVGTMSIYSDWVRWKVLSQCGSTYTCLSRSVPEIHSHVAGTQSNQQTNQSFDNVCNIFCVLMPMYAIFFASSCQCMQYLLRLMPMNAIFFASSCQCMQYLLRHHANVCNILCVLMPMYAIFFTSSCQCMQYSLRPHVNVCNIPSVLTPMSAISSTSSCQCLQYSQRPYANVCNILCVLMQCMQYSQRPPYANVCNILCVLMPMYAVMSGCL